MVGRITCSKTSIYCYWIINSAKCVHWHPDLAHVFYTMYFNLQKILDTRQQRQQRKEELSNRRSAASIERMRIISKLAHDPNSNTLNFLKTFIPVFCCKFQPQETSHIAAITGLICLVNVFSQGWWFPAGRSQETKGRYIWYEWWRLDGLQAYCKDSTCLVYRIYFIHTLKHHG